MRITQDNEERRRLVDEGWTETRFSGRRGVFMLVEPDPDAVDPPDFMELVRGWLTAA